ncbi:Sua5/YciO/YrdC/YwlC family protein [Helicobacter sp. T3_23-1059]
MKELDFDCPIFLTQSDTTAGFLCANAKKLNAIKKRAQNQKILLALSDFRELKSRFRIPPFAKKIVRNAKKTSFILPNKESFRVVAESKKLDFTLDSNIDFSNAHREFLSHFGGLYSTSANESGKPFNLAWALQNADIIVLNSRGIFEAKPSKIYKLSKHKAKILRH